MDPLAVLGSALGLGSGADALAEAANGCLFSDLPRLAHLIQRARATGPASPFAPPSDLDMIADEELSCAWQTCEFLDCDHTTTRRYLHAVLLRRLLRAGAAERATWLVQFDVPELQQLRGALRDEVAALGAPATPELRPFTLYTRAWVPGLAAGTPEGVVGLWELATWLGCDAPTLERIEVDLLQRRLRGDAPVEWSTVLHAGAVAAHVAGVGMAAALDAAQVRVLRDMRGTLGRATELAGVYNIKLRGGVGGYRVVSCDAAGRLYRSFASDAVWGGAPGPAAAYFGHGMALVAAVDAAEQCAAVAFTAATGDTASVRELVTRRGYALDGNALHQAAASGHADTARALVRELGAPVDARDAVGRTALHRAATEGHVATVRVLATELGAAADARNANGWTALHCAATYGHVATVRALVTELGAAVDARDEDGNTALHEAAMGGHDATVRALVTELGADVDARDERGNTALHWAAEDGHVATVRALVTELGAAAVDARGEDGRTALHWAAMYGHVATVRALVTELGAAVDARDELGRTPLHRAAAQGHVATVRALVTDLGAAVDARDTEGRMPLHWAATFDHEAEWPSENGDVAAVRALVTELGAAVDTRDDVGWTALHWAAARGQAATVRALVTELGATVDVRDEEGRTALHRAAASGHADTARALVTELGAAVDAPDADGCTALHWAAMEGHVATVCALVTELGAAVDARDGEGRTALHRATTRGHDATVRALTELGAAV